MVVAILWALYLVAFADEAVSLARFRSWPTPGRQAARSRGLAARIVSLNCAGGDAKAAAEVAGYQPDIVLLQESPGSRSLEHIGQQLFGKDAAMIAGFDASVIVRGMASPVPVPRSLRGIMTQAHVRLTSGFEAEVVSTRLTPILFRPELWSLDTWRSQRQNREARREQVRQIAEQLAQVPKGVPLIVGGDLNAPAGDAAFRLLQPRLRDAFREGGVGWGDTATNDTPILRIDQIWVSEQLRPVAVLARKTRYSDHRMVICDVVLLGSIASTP
jgi:endonuclease/exonuclease/phosphatase family metal-dependent hydrolase